MPKTARFADGSIKVVAVLPSGKKIKKTFSSEAEYLDFVDSLSSGKPATEPNALFETDTVPAPSRRSNSSRSA